MGSDVLQKVFDVIDRNITNMFKDVAERVQSRC
jgi:hypothetical protein